MFNIDDLVVIVKFTLPDNPSYIEKYESSNYIERSKIGKIVDTWVFRDKAMVKVQYETDDSPDSWNFCLEDQDLELCYQL